MSFMGYFPNTTVENKPYPTVIMGEDSFTGWFGKGNYPDEVVRAALYEDVLNSAYRLGVRGFSISPHPTLAVVLRRFKEGHPDIIVIANPHWQSHYYVDGQSLWTSQNRQRLLATVAALLPESIRAGSDLLRGVASARSFSEQEIARFRLDEAEFQARLAEFKGLADFVIVGNLSFGALIYTGREDIIRREIALARAAGLIPLAISEGGGCSAEKLQRLDAAGMWIWANRTLQFPVPMDLAALVQGAVLPLTAFRIFEHPDGFDIAASLSFILDSGKIPSIVVGVDDKRQAEETFAMIRTFFKRT